VAVVGIALGAVVVALMALVLMVVGMSDPAVPWVGLTPGADGVPNLVVQREGARGVTEVSLEAETSFDVLWSVERVSDEVWDGVVPVGGVPRGFEERVPARTESFPAGSTIVVTNGCYGSYVTMPRGALTPGAITTDDGVLDIDEFSAEGSAFSSCGPDDLKTPLAIAGGGVVLLLGGIVLLVATAGRRIT